MAKFFRMQMIIDNETIANGAKNWFQNKIDTYPKAEFYGDGVVSVIEELGEPGSPSTNYIVSFDVRFAPSVSRDNVLDAIKAKAQEAGVKNNIVSFKCWKHECTHGEANPTPCTNTLMFEYTRD